MSSIFETKDAGTSPGGAGPKELDMVHWKAGAVNSDSGNGASVEVRAEDDNGQIYGEGLVRVTERGELATTLPRGEGPPDLPDSIRGAVGFGLGGLEGLQKTVARVAREA